MPPKPASKKAKIVCDLCRAAVVDGKEDALQCEGCCGSWYHRYCAGVPLTYFQELANSSTPFVCLHCSQKAHKTTVAQLQSEVVLLKAEVAELRAALDTARANPVSDTAHAASDSQTQASSSWATATGHRKGRKKPTSKKNFNQPGASSTGEPNRAHTSNAAHREVVSGVRRVWGTLSSTPPFVVKNTIVKIAKIENPGSIQVKRKYKTTRLGKNIWWFLIHAEEDTILKDLVLKWENIKLQTGWCLEPCTKPHTKPVPMLPVTGQTAESQSLLKTSELANSTHIACEHIESPTKDTSLLCDAGPNKPTSPTRDSDSFLFPTLPQHQQS